MFATNAFGLKLDDQCVGLDATANSDYLSRPPGLPKEYDGSYIQRTKQVIQGETISVIEKYLGIQYSPSDMEEVADLFKLMGEAGIGPKLHSYDAAKRLLVMEDLKTQYNQVFDGRLMQSLRPMQRAGLLTEADVKYLESMYEIFQNGRMHLDSSPKNFIIVKDYDKPARLYMLDNIRPPGSKTTVEELQQVKAAIRAAMPFPKP